MSLVVRASTCGQAWAKAPYSGGLLPQVSPESSAIRKVPATLSPAGTADFAVRPRVRLPQGHDGLRRPPGSRTLAIRRARAMPFGIEAPEPGRSGRRFKELPA